MTATGRAKKNRGGTSNPETLFSKSLRPEVETDASKRHLLKSHFTGALREFVGFVDMMASLDPERFVWASDAEIADHMKRYHGKKYTRSQAKRCKRHARSKEIISGQVKRMRGGILREGFIVVAHADACKMTGNLCVLSLQKMPFVAPEVSLAVTPLVTLAVTPQVILTGDVSCHQFVTPVRDTKKMILNAMERHGYSKSQEQISGRIPGRIPAPSRVAVLTGRTEQPLNLQKPTAKPKPVVLASHDETPTPVGQKSVGQHFDYGVFGSPIAFVRALTDGLYNEKTELWQDYAAAHRNALHAEGEQVIYEWESEPYLGRQTNRALMNIIMQRLGAEGIAVPIWWLPVMAQLSGEEHEPREFNCFEDWQEAATSRLQDKPELEETAPGITEHEALLAELAHGSVFAEIYWKEMALFETELVEAVKTHGMPHTNGEGIALLDAMYSMENMPGNLWSVRCRMEERIPRELRDWTTPRAVEVTSPLKPARLGLQDSPAGVVH